MQTHAYARIRKHTHALAHIRTLTHACAPLHTHTHTYARLADELDLSLDLDKKQISTILSETGKMITLMLITLMTITLITLIIRVIGAPLVATTI